MKTKNFAEVIKKELDSDPKLKKLVEEEILASKAKQKLYDETKQAVKHLLSSMDSAERIEFFYSLGYCLRCGFETPCDYCQRGE